MRILKSPNDFFDLLDKIGNNKFVAIGYVTGANLDVPKVKRKNPLTNRMKSYDDYTVFSAEGEDEIGALVKLTSYNFRYTNRKTVSKNYGKYKNDVNGIRQEFGLEPMQDRNSYKQANNFGVNGIENYSGENEKLFGHTYNPQNIYGARHPSITYAVNKEGRIIKALTEEQILPYLKKKNQEPSGVKALREMNVEEKVIAQYIQKIKDLKFKYINFESDSILYMAATVDGEKIAYINDNLKRIINEINIQPQDFVKIARERYQIDVNNLQETYNRMIKKVIHLKESDLRHMVYETVARILNEGRNAHRYSYISHNGNGMIGGKWESWEINGSGNILKKFIQNLERRIGNNEELDNFIDYCYDNEDVFDVYANISGSYDESSGYGSTYMPLYQIEEIEDTSDMEEYVMNYPSNKGFKQVVLKILDDTLNSLDVDDFNVDEESEW